MNSVAVSVGLKAGGMTVLPISGNDYDDLEARFALDAETIKALRGNNILYDRDETGEPRTLQAETGVLALRPRLATHAGRDHDELGLSLAQAFIVEPVLLQSTQFEIFNDHIAMLNQIM